MKSRLFWKILLAFWATFLFILQGVWMAYAMLWGDRSSYEWTVAQTIAPYQLAAAQLAIERGGPDKLAEVAQGWAHQGRDEPDWNRLAIAAADGPLPRDDPHAMRVRAVDPEARAWDISYTMPTEKWRDARDGGLAAWLYVPLEWAVPAACGGLLFSAALAWYLTRPIRLLRQGFQSLAGGRLDTRLRPQMGRRRDEIADMATDFDGMAERLQQLVGARDRLLHDVSHELRSPLARMSLAVALAEKDSGILTEPLRRIALEVGRLDRLVGELLSLSRHESGPGEPDAYFDMRSLAAAVVADAAFEARASGVEIALRADVAGQMLMRGSAELIRRALENVIRNAVQFSPKGGRIDVALRLDGAARRVELAVADQGPGVPPHDLERMCEPFVRLADGGQRQGYGLGLAIASRAVESHAGRLAIANRPAGGLLVTLSLPASDVAPELAERVSGENA